jgi:hypothetical protein
MDGWCGPRGLDGDSLSSRGLRLVFPSWLRGRSSAGSLSVRAPGIVLPDQREPWRPWVECRFPGQWCARGKAKETKRMRGLTKRLE